MESLTPLVYFNGTNGANPFGGVTLGGDGKIYGTTTYGGISNSGTVISTEDQRRADRPDQFLPAPMEPTLRWFEL